MKNQNLITELRQNADINKEKFIKLRDKYLIMLAINETNKSIDLESKEEVLIDSYNMFVKDKKSYYNNRGDKFKEHCISILNSLMEDKE